MSAPVVTIWYCRRSEALWKSGKSKRETYSFSSPKGRLDTTTSREFEAKVQDVLNGGSLHLLVDFGSIDYVSSAGLRVLLMLGKKLPGMGGSLVLCSLSSAVLEVFEVSGFTRIFAISPNRGHGLGEAQKLQEGAGKARRGRRARKAKKKSEKAPAAKDEQASAASEKSASAAPEPAPPYPTAGSSTQATGDAASDRVEWLVGGFQVGQR